MIRNDKFLAELRFGISEFRIDLSISQVEENFLKHRVQSSLDAYVNIFQISEIRQRRIYRANLEANLGNVK